jgi:phosphoribosylformylglycinamidine synthase subunit PurS
VKATVLVRPNPGILDPQGQAVASSLRHLGFDVGETRVGRLVDVELATDDRAEALAQLERMCEQLLTNPLIESYLVQLADDTAEVPAGVAAGQTQAERATRSA